MRRLVCSWGFLLSWCGTSCTNSRGLEPWEDCQVFWPFGLSSPTSCTCRTTGGPGWRGSSSSSSSGLSSLCWQSLPSSLSSPSPFTTRSHWRTLRVCTCLVFGASWLWSGPSCSPCLLTVTVRSLLTSAFLVTSKVPKTSCGKLYRLAFLAGGRGGGCRTLSLVTLLLFTQYAVVF